MIMTSFPSLRIARAALVSGIAATALTGCMGAGSAPQLPSANFVANQQGPGEGYTLGPLDATPIFVWRNPETGSKAPVPPHAHRPTPCPPDLPPTEQPPQ